MGTALAIYEKVENPIAFCDAMAETCAAITGCSLQQGKGVALTCLCEGITPHEYARTYHNIQGKSSMRADAMLAHFRTKYGGKHKVVERSATRAAIELVNSDGDIFAADFTWEDAQGSRWPWKDPEDHKKGLKDNWSTPTDQKNMLWARLVSDSIRAFQPEVVAGIYTPEELQDANVVETVIKTDAPARLTAAEAMAAAANHTNGNGSSATDAPPFEAAENIEDAEYTPASPDQPPAEEGFATKAQIERLNDLRRELNMPVKAWDDALAKRNARTAHGLKVADAQEIIDKLEARRRTAPAAKN